MFLLSSSTNNAPKSNYRTTTQADISLKIYIMSIPFKKRKQPRSLHILISKLTTSVLQSDFCFCPSNHMFTRNIWDKFIEFFFFFWNFLILKFLKTNEVNLFQISRRWTWDSQLITPEQQPKSTERRGKNKNVTFENNTSKNSNVVNFIFDSSSVRTVSGKFQNSGNLYLLQTLMKRFSKNDYSTCIILLTDL